MALFSSRSCTARHTPVARYSSYATGAFLCLTLLSLALPAFSQSAAAQEVVAHIDAVTGQAFVNRDADRLAAEAGLKVHRLDEVMTYGDGRLRLNFRDGTVITVGPNSRVLVQHYLDTLGGADSRAPLLTLVVGILRAAVPKIGSLGWSVQTRAAVASSRSTEWIMEARGETTSLVVIAGRVDVMNGAGEALLLTGGEGVDITLGALMPATASRWAAARVIAFAERTSLR